MTFRIRHVAPDTWLLERELKRGIWPFRFTIVQSEGSFSTEENALEHLAIIVEFKPVTTYYNKHGERYLEAVGW